MIIDSRCVKDDGKKNCFGILLREPAKGWRIGYLIVRERTIKRLECHPDSLETFEPVSGRSIIALASHKNPNAPKVFFLDKPVVVKKGVWHDVAAISKRAEIKIFENIEVKTNHHPLKTEISV
jgi:ureidoglycolate hydrolase